MAEKWIAKKGDRVQWDALLVKDNKGRNKRMTGTISRIVGNTAVVKPRRGRDLFVLIKYLQPLDTGGEL